MIFEDEAAQLRNGDMDALVPLMQRYQHQLYRYLKYMVRKTNIAEDLFQQTWLRVIERIQYYDPSRSFKVWLFAVAHNLTIDYRRKKQPINIDNHFSGSTDTFFTERPYSVEPSALELLIANQQADLVRKTIAELPASFCEVLTLRFMEGMKLVEIAEFLVIPLGTVKTRLHRAMKGFHKACRKKAEWNPGIQLICS